MRQLTKRVAALEEAQSIDPKLLQRELETLRDAQIEAIIRGEAVGSPAVMQYLQSLDELSDAELNAIIEEA